MAYSLIRSLLFRLEAERAHDWACGALRATQGSALVRRAWARAWRTEDPRLGQSVLGLRFANPVALAAGFDKDARLIPALAAFGFGGIEVGTVTPRPQPGNARPRVWRHAAARSLQNSLGFNSAGMETVARRLARLTKRPVPLGVNLGKNRDTPMDEAEQDYEQLLRRFAELADYFVINVSSPNTRRLRDLQAPEFLQAVLRSARMASAAPTLVKIAPDLPAAAAVEICAAAVEAGAAGIIATNTTTDYALIPGSRRVGGLSGAVLRERSFALLRRLAATLAGRAVLISAGGVDTAAEAYRRLRAGASLVQLYTAFVFEGPGLPGRINAGLLEHLERDGLSHVSEAIGADL